MGYQLLHRHIQHRPGERMAGALRRQHHGGIIHRNPQRPLGILQAGLTVGGIQKDVAVGQVELALDLRRLAARERGLHQTGHQPVFIDKGQRLAAQVARLFGLTRRQPRRRPCGERRHLGVGEMGGRVHDARRFDAGRRPFHLGVEPMVVLDDARPGLGQLLARDHRQTLNHGGPEQPRKRLAQLHVIKGGHGIGHGQFEVELELETDICSGHEDTRTEWTG